MRLFSAFMAVGMACGAAWAVAQDNSAQSETGVPSQPADETATEEIVREVRVPLERQPYRIRVLISFANDATLSARLRADVRRRIRSHASAFVGDAWQLDIKDVSSAVALASREQIAAATMDLISEHMPEQDKLFLLGVRSEGDRFVVSAREFDVLFERWGPIFSSSAREPTQIARELVVLAARMFSPLARLETGDARRVNLVIKGGLLPTLNPDAIERQAKYKPSFQFVPTGTLFRAMQPVFNDDRTEILGMGPKGWTFYAVEARDRQFATCRIDSALRNTLPPVSENPDEPQLIVARTPGGPTVLRLVDTENHAPLPAMDIEVVETVGGASFPLGTTDSDGRILIPPNRTANPIVWVFVRHGRDTMARLPILPGAGDESDLALNPDAIRLDIEGRVMAMQTQIIDQVARRAILAGNRSAITNTMEGGMIRKAIEKKEFAQAESLLKQLKESPSADAMAARLEAAKEYARAQRPEEKWTGKIKRLFLETEEIIKVYFDPEIFEEVVGELEDDLKFRKEDAAAEAADGKSQSAPAAGSSALTYPTGNSPS